MKSRIIDQYEPRAVFRGLLDGEGFRNRVAGSCIYRCPHCKHGVRFRWRSFYHADNRSIFKQKLRGVFDDLTPNLPADEQGFLDFHCPSCGAATRIIFRAQGHTQNVYHFEIYGVLVGERLARQ